RGIRAAAYLHLVRHFGGEGRHRGPPGAEHDGDRRTQRLVFEPDAGGQAKALAGKAAPIAGQQPAADLDRLAHRLQRPRLLEAETVEPRPVGEPEEGTSAGNEVERGDLAGDLDRVERVRIERCGADADALGRRSYEDERDDRGLEQQVMKD